MLMFKFEGLKVYQKSLDFIDLVYMISTDFPAEEIYGLTSQFKRAPTSIALNIVEGSGSTNKDFNRYLRNAYKSLKECAVCCTVAFRQKFISEDIYRN